MDLINRALAAPIPAVDPLGQSYQARDFAGLVRVTITAVINPLIALIAALALFYVLSGTLKFIKSAGDAKAREQAKDSIIYGIIGLFVMASVWGLVRIISGTFNLDTGSLPIPNF